VQFDGADVTRLPSHALVRRGLVLVPEGRRMLPAMSVEENLQVAASVRGAEGYARIPQLLDRFPILRARRNVPAGSLSGGEQQMLAIARALAIGPRALLLDEPSMGLAPKLVDEIFAIVADERARGTSILLVEQNARRALALADRAYVMERGRITLSGTGAELAMHRDVVAAYLGS
jgi:branched-chain amino acid transport system ATP-binding protein